MERTGARGKEPPGRPEEEHQMPTLTDLTAMKILIDARLVTLRGGRPLAASCRVPRRN